MSVEGLADALDISNDGTPYNCPFSQFPVNCWSLVQCGVLGHTVLVTGRHRRTSKMMCIHISFRPVGINTATFQRSKSAVSGLLQDPSYLELGLGWNLTMLVGEPLHDALQREQQVGRSITYCEELEPLTIDSCKAYKILAHESFAAVGGVVWTTMHPIMFNCGHCAQHVHNILSGIPEVSVLQTVTSMDWLTTLTVFSTGLLIDRWWYGSQRSQWYMPSAYAMAGLVVMCILYLGSVPPVKHILANGCVGGVCDPTL